MNSRSSQTLREEERTQLGSRELVDLVAREKAFTILDLPLFSDSLRWGGSGSGGSDGTDAELTIPLYEGTTLLMLIRSAL